MDLNRQQLSTRWFFASLAIWDEFRGRGDTSDRYQRGTNLCHFMRVVLVYAPLAVLTFATVIAFAVFVVVFEPALLFGTGNYVLTIVALVSLIAAIIGIKWYQERHQLTHDEEEERKERRIEEREARKVAKAARGPSFLAILWTYIVSVKRKFCPTINFVNSSAAEAA